MNTVQLILLIFVSVILLVTIIVTIWTMAIWEKDKRAYKESMKEMEAQDMLRRALEDDPKED